MSPKSLSSQLIVEGKDDQRVIWSICQTYNIPETFTVEVASYEDHIDGGVDELLRGIPVRLKTAGLQNIGIVVDADTDLDSRWQAISTRLRHSGYTNIPIHPSAQGTIIEQDNLPRFGIWIMPDNRLPGMLENFVAQLIPNDDNLAPIAKDILRYIEDRGLNRYSSIHHPKAFIHTWLAWQQRPGRPMGQSITARVLQLDNPLAIFFVEWLRRLFQA